MKKLSVLALVAMLFVACGGKNAKKSSEVAVVESSSIEEVVATPVHEAFASMKHERQGWDGPPLYGDVESVVVASNEWYSDELISRMFKFNERGDVYEVVYCQDGQYIPNILYKYDNNGKMIEQQLYIEGTLAKRVFVRYDAEGKKKEINEYNAQGRLLQRINYIYDAEGRLAKMIDDDRIDNRRYEFSFAYDSQGNMIKGTEYETPLDDECQSGFTSHEYTYDLNGNMTTDRYCCDDNVEGASVDITYTYDARGREINRKTIIDGGETTEELQIFKYAAADKLIEVEFLNWYTYTPGEITRSTCVYEYDFCGNRIAIVKYNSDKSERTVLEKVQITYRKK